MHSDDLAETLRKLKNRLDGEGISFALIGALALRHFGYKRYTEDIDLLTTPQGLDRIHDRLVGRGLVPRAHGLRKRLRDTEYRVDIDIVTSGERAGSEGSPVVYPDPGSKNFHTVDGIRIPDLPALIGFKLASGIWGHRERDLGDVQELIRINGLKADFAKKLPMPLRAKFRSLLKQARRQREIE
ncbi:MAG: hypothetical protein HY716_04640 [Planctomycetes bacterium]|nr:hypothetical protein [Planctomycetota bacterium]